MQTQIPFGNDNKKATTTANAEANADPYGMTTKRTTATTTARAKAAANTGILRCAQNDGGVGFVAEELALLFVARKRADSFESARLRCNRRFLRCAAE
jgi:hypothetical protein